MRIGSKTLSLDPVWSAPPVDEIEEQLLRYAAFPELAAGGSAMRAEFVILDPSLTAESPANDDLPARVSKIAARMNLSVVSIGHHSADAHGTGGFPHSIDELAAMSDDAYATAFATLRDRVGWVLASSRFSRRRHIFIPQFDAALVSAVIELLAQQPASSRPFVHLATRWDEERMPNIQRIGDLSSVGRAVHQMNSERTTTFFYAWARPLAQRLAIALGQPVRPLDPPPELSLASEGEQQGERLCVGFFGAASRARGFHRLPTIIRWANQAASHPRRLRFVVQHSPDAHEPKDILSTAAAELGALPERNVSLIEDALPPKLFYSAIKQVDAVLLPYSTDEYAERISNTALHAMAAGKLVFTLETARLPGTLKSRVVTARNDQELGEIIADFSADLASVRTNSQVAKATYWATLRPSRLFAQLLYGPTVLGTAAAP